MKIGDYVRTTSGIKRLKKEYDNGWFFEKSMIIKHDNIEKYIIKSSPRIIDLIEAGDYVNGLKVQEVNNEIKGFGTIVFDKDNSIMEDYIYSIVTKEMFSSVEYRVEND